MSGLIMRFPKGKAKALTLSYDDGVEQDIRLMDIMDKNGLKGTFNLNSGLFAPEGTTYPEGAFHRRLTARQATETYAASGHEVAVHGLTHPFLERLPENLAMWELLKDRENLDASPHHYPGNGIPLRHLQRRHCGLPEKGRAGIRQDGHLQPLLRPARRLAQAGGDLPSQ